MTDREQLALLKLEATAHIIGAFGDYPREFGPGNWLVDTRQTQEVWLDLPCASSALVYLQARIHNLKVVDHDWLSADVMLMDVNGVCLGLRPAYVYGRPYDVPVYTNFHIPDFGHVSLGLRVTQ